MGDVVALPRPVVWGGDLDELRSTVTSLRNQLAAAEAQLVAAAASVKDSIGPVLMVTVTAFLRESNARDPDPFKTSQARQALTVAVTAIEEADRILAAAAATTAQEESSNV